MAAGLTDSDVDSSDDSSLSLLFTTALTALAGFKGRVRLLVGGEREEQVRTAALVTVVAFLASDLALAIVEEGEG